MCRSGNTEYEQNGGQKGENARIAELLIAVVTIYSVERRAPRRERLVPCEEAPPSFQYLFSR